MLSNGQPVLCTTEFRGVFFGYIAECTKLPAEITLTNARNVLSWPANCDGFLGLASKGVTSSCRIGAKVAALRLYQITSVALVEENAVQTWEAL